MREQIVMHEVVIALLVLFGQALVLIQVYTSYVGEIVVAIFIACYQIFVSADRCGTGCQTQYAVRLVDDQCTNIVCSFSAHIVIIFGFDNSHIAYSPVSDNIFCAGTSPATLFILIHPDFFLNCFKKIIVPGLLIRLQFTRAWAVSGNQMCRSCGCKTPEGTLYKHSAVLKKNRKPLLRGASDVPGFSCRRALSIFNFLYLSNGGLFPSIRM